ncbi:MAG TPA: HemK/PrmC family methyltransferase [Actinomycetota bacterium]|nr:HemK/PrmC family methyltransferase [Actinomycetota bacterium]
MTAGELLDEGAARIAASEAIDLWRPYMARLEAQELLAAALGTGEAPDEGAPVAAPARRRYQGFLDRRVGGEPAALIVGHVNFRGLQLRTRPGVFIPRTSSESLAGGAIRRLRGRRQPVAVDVATGSGPVALAMAAEVPKAQVYGVDISGPALALARFNAKRLGLPNVTFLRSDVLAALPRSLAGAVDVVTAHPPYVARSQVDELPAEIRQFEPLASLTDASEDGLGLVRELVAEAPGWLRRGGWMLIEVSPDLSRKVGGLLRRNGYREVKSHKDVLGATRVVGGRR